MNPSGPVAFVTDAKRPQLTDDDRLVLTPAAALGVELVPARWDDPGEDWARFRKIILRSTWTYHQQLDRFEGWLGELEGLPVANALPTLRRNLRKTYLSELSSLGVPILPTAWPRVGDDLATIARDHGWHDVVAKPVVSAGSWNTFRGPPDALGDAQALSDAGVQMMLQAFCPAVLDEGEWSLIFLGGRFSHAILKVPAAQQYFVQEEYGGRILPRVAPAQLHTLARAALDAWRLLAPEAALYARVDLLRGPEGYAVAELELIEPSLYLGLDPQAPTRFATAILASLND